MGTDDPRLNSVGKIDFRIQRTIKAWKMQDPPPHRVKPIPIQVIRQLACVARNSSPTFAVYQATVDMIIIAFFFLLRPGEYTDSPSESTPFRIEDVQLFIGQTRLCLLTASIGEIQQARFGSLTFTTQKNAVRNEVIGLACSGDSYLCPVKALARRIIYWRQHSTNTQLPVARVFEGSQRVTSAFITKTIRDALADIGPSLGFLPADVSGRCLRAAGANALLLARIDPDVIRLIGRWRSDEMLRYLHVQAAPLMQDYARKMLLAGSYTLIPNQLVPQH